jgi:hypothetical protein
MGADTIGNGPPIAAQLFGTEGLYLDRVNNNLYSFGASKVPVLVQSALAALGPQTALTAITTAQNLLTFAFGAGALNLIGRTIEVSGNLIYSTTAANVATITIALTLGGVTLATITTAATNTTASTNLPINFSFTATVTATGAAGTLITTGAVNANIGTASSAAVASYLAPSTGNSAAVNLTTAETLAVTIAASAAVPSATLLNASVQILA